MKNIIVSAFLSKINANKNRNIEKYIDLGKKLLANQVMKIIFIDEEMITYFKNYENEFTIFVEIKKEDMYFYDYVDTITDFYVNTTTPDKDTLEYMFMMCYKTEYVKKAIEINQTNANDTTIHKTNYIWIDFAIFHMMGGNQLDFEKYISSLSETTYDAVRIASGWCLEHNVENNINIYRDIIWGFLGSIFGGDESSLLLFANLMKEKCIHIMKEKKTLCWEINIWYLLYKEYPTLFSPYYAEHNISILKNY